MRVTNKHLIIIIALIVFWSCDDVFEDDISNDMVQTLSPINNQTIEGNSVQFTWLPLKGADNYRIQVANSSQNTVLDSLVSGNSFNFTLNSGDYSWRLKGENFAYQTAYTFQQNFSVVASNDLSNQTVVLSTPSANTYSNAINTIFTWQNLETADEYEFDLVKNNSTSQTIYQESNITTTSVSLDGGLFNEDAEYIWRVRANNTTSNTQTVFSERSYFLDTQSPNQPALNLPVDQATEQTTTTVTFDWILATDTGSVQSNLSSVIEISTDANFSTITASQTTTSTSYQYVFNIVGEYYWRVKTNDSAGNTSVYSNVRLITIE